MEVNGGIIGSKAKSCCNGVQHHFLRVRWLGINRKMIGEAIYLRVCDRKYNPIATKRGNVLTRSCRSKSAVFRMYTSLTSHGYSKSIKAVRRQRNLGLVFIFHIYIVLKLKNKYSFLKSSLKL